MQNTTFLSKTTATASLLLLLFLLLIGTNSAQNPVAELSETFTPQELKSDLQVIQKNFEKLHIGLYSYTSKEKLDTAFSRIAAEIDKPLTAMEFFRKITKLNKLIGNGHTSFSPPKPILDAIRTTLPSFPFEVFWDGRSLYVLQNLSNDSNIKPGTKIKSINGKPSETIIYEMADKIKRDGYNTTYPVLRSSRLFPIHYAVLQEIVDKFVLELEEASGTIRKATIDGLSVSKIEENRFSRYKTRKTAWEDTNDPALALFINGDIATMKVRTFQKELIKKKRQDWKKFFKKSFGRIRKKGVNHLIIDLRDNNGGQPSPPIRLLSHLIDKPFSIYKSINTKVGKVPTDPYFIRDGSIENFESIGWTKKGTLFELKDKKVFKLNKPYKHTYRGKLYILTNAFSTSATSSFAGQLKSRTKAIFIGEETGGNPNQTVARQVIALILPNTKIKIVIPLVLSVKSVNFENTGRGIIPDHQINPAIDDVLTKKDVVMEYTLNLIRKGS